MRTACGAWHATSRRPLPGVLLEAMLMLRRMAGFTGIAIRRPTSRREEGAGVESGSRGVGLTTGVTMLSVRSTMETMSYFSRSRAPAMPSKRASPTHASRASFRRAGWVGACMAVIVACGGAIDPECERLGGGDCYRASSFCGYATTRDFKAAECLPRCGASGQCPAERVAESRPSAPNPEATTYETVLTTHCVCVLQGE